MLGNAKIESRINADLDVSDFSVDLDLPAAKTSLLIAQLFTEIGSIILCQLTCCARALKKKFRLIGRNVDFLVWSTCRKSKRNLFDFDRRDISALDRRTDQPIILYAMPWDLDRVSSYGFGTSGVSPHMRLARPICVSTSSIVQNINNLSFCSFKCVLTDKERIRSRKTWKIH